MKKNLARLVLHSLLYISIFTIQAHLSAVDEEVTQTIINLNHEGDSLDALKATFKEIPSLLSGRVRITNSLLCTGPVQINPTQINGPSLSVSGGSMFNGNVDVSGSVTTNGLIAQTLTVPNQTSFGNTTINGNLAVTNNASISGNTNVSGSLSAGSALISGPITTSSDLSVAGNASIATNVTIGGTTTVNDLNALGSVTIGNNLFSQNLNMSPIAPPAATNNGILFVSDGTAPAINTGDLYYRLPVLQGGAIVDVLSGGGSSGVVSLSQGNGIILTPNPITTTGVISTNSTSANTANTLVQRDASGNFSAGTIMANLTGAASLNVLKSGDSMSGTLNMLNQNSIRWQDGSGFGNYAGIRAPTTVGSSYTVALPATGPLGGQFLQANASNPLNLEWITPGGGTQPAASKIIYVTKYGNDATGDGSFIKPYASLAQALILANSLSSSSNPITISIAPGIYVEIILLRR